MNRKPLLIATITLAATASSGAAFAVAAAGGEPVPNVTLAAPVQATRTYSAGPEATYQRSEGPSTHVTGGYAEVEPMIGTVPDQAKSYDALVTMSFRYTTRGSGPFTAHVNVDTRLGASDDLPTLPRSAAPLSPSTKQTSSSTQFIVRALKAGKAYRFQPMVETRAPKKPGKNQITSSGWVLTVQFTPHS